MSRPRLWLALLLLVPTGCSDGRLKCYPVSGQVFVDGQPAEGALVYFFPVNAGDPQAMRATGPADASGAFVMSTYVTGDGVPAGEYLVAFEWLEKHRLKGTFEGADRLKGKYYPAEKSEFRVTVQKHPMKDLRFDLKP